MATTTNEQLQNQTSNSTPASLSGRFSAISKALGPAYQPVGQRVLVEVDPADLIEDPKLTALRSWTGSSDQEQDIPALAQLIFEEGQLVPAIVRPTDDGLMVVDGLRRKRAVQLIRATTDERTGELIYPDCKLWVEVQELDDAQARKVAITSFKRKDLTPIEKARVMKAIRAECPKEIADCTEFVADYLGVSPATVRQTEKLLSLPVEQQAKVQSGEMSADAALELLRGVPEKRAEVTKKAEEKARQRQQGSKKEAEKKDGVGDDGGGVPVDSQPDADIRERQEPGPDHGVGGGGEQVEGKVEPTTDGRLEPSTSGSGGADKPAVSTKSPKPPAPAKVLRKDVTAAQREVEGSVSTARAPKISDVVEVVEGWAEEQAYPEVMREWATETVKWMRGKGAASYKSVGRKWDAVADGLLRKGAGEIGRRRKASAAVKPDNPAKGKVLSSKTKSGSGSGYGSSNKPTKRAKSGGKVV